MTKEELKSKKISAISLGCDKNRVDLEHMLFGLQEYGFEITPAIEDAEVIIVNTCAFIEPAIIEACENIALAVSMKTEGKAEKVIVSGCLPMREKGTDLHTIFDGVDAFITLNDNQNITSILERLYDVKESAFEYDGTGRILTTAGGYAYLKIAEGCSNGCAYCTIPRIRGRFRSIPQKELLKKAKRLVEMGYKEIILVAQDTARYGEDLYGEPRLLELLEELCKIKGLEWIRLQYIYPEWLDEKLLDFIVKNDKMCKYIDMPLQHIDDTILKNMNRKSGEEKCRGLVDLISEKYPEIELRSTFIVGFPGETRKQFQKLCDFIAEDKIRFASFFTYFREEKTKAYYMPKQVPKFIKNRRLKKVEEIQNINLNRHALSQIGTVQRVLVDEFDPSEKFFLSHSQKNSPNVDLCVIIEADNPNSVNVTTGDFVNVRIVDLHEKGFKGEVIL